MLWIYKCSSFSPNVLYETQIKFCARWNSVKKFSCPKIQRHVWLKIMLNETALGEEGLWFTIGIITILLSGNKLKVFFNFYTVPKQNTYLAFCCIIRKPIAVSYWLTPGPTSYFIRYWFRVQTLSLEIYCISHICYQN